jgi:hypothetical protein
VAASRWYVYDTWRTAKDRGTVLASTIDVALNLARARWGHNVAVTDLTPERRFK